ncbi:MAG: hypothetical protein ACPG5B_15645 [Chitinophagales bacterium]
MQIKNAKDIDKLDKKIKDELGIDVQKYRNEEVVENFVSLLVFPRYIINWTIRPIIWSILLFFFSFGFIDLVHIEYILYLFIGFFLFSATGFLFGLLFLTWRMKSDIWQIINYSLDIMHSMIKDLNQINHQINPENRKNVLGLLFKGIIHILTIPMLSQIVAEKVPFVGGIIKIFLKKILTLIANVIKFDEAILKRELQKDSKESNTLQMYSKSIAAASVGLEKIINLTFKIAQLPLKIAFTISLVTLVYFIYLIH